MRWVIRALASCIVGLAALAPFRADAACTTSAILVTVQGGADELTATWHLDPPCDVVETGLMVGRERDALSRVTAALHSSGPFYTHTIPVTESALYWVAAYAIDEDGNIITSSAEFAPIIANEQSGPHGSHGALPSYSGTDADFLVQAGNPHFASLRALELTTSSQTEHLIFGTLQTSRAGSRVVGSMHRGEVETGQASALPFGLAANPAQLATALAAFDQLYNPPSFFFPRPGFYAVSCTAEQSSSGALTSTCSRSFFNAAGGLFISAQNNDTEIAGSFRAIRTASSSVRFFIPAATEDRQVENAQLTSLIFTQSTPDAAPQPRLNGKVPVSSALTCGRFHALFPEGVNCTGRATWDFTEEIRAVAASGGGEFTITPDQIDQFTINELLPSGHIQVIKIGQVSVSLGSNYPWSHLGPANNALTISFAQACPKGLSVSATPTTVTPPRPGVLGGTVQIRAEVTTCPGGTSPTSVVVNLEVDQASPQPGTPDANGHLHDTRPASARGRLDASSCTVVIGTNGTGSCTTTYRPSEVGSVERIVATASGFPSADTKVRVENPGLLPLAADPSRYVLVGAPENHTGTNDPCRLPPTSQHSPNHSGRAAMNQAVLDIADAMLQDTGILARVNDMSLPMGGLFDFRNLWQADHRAHRIGQDADIGLQGVLGSTCVSYDRGLLEFHIVDVTNKFPLRHSDHYHVFMPALP